MNAKVLQAPRIVETEIVSKQLGFKLRAMSGQAKYFSSTVDEKLAMLELCETIGKVSVTKG